MYMMKVLISTMLGKRLNLKGSKLGQILCADKIVNIKVVVVV